MLKFNRVQPVWAMVVRFFNREAGYAAILLLLMLAAYGWQMITPGFYWDDWQAVYLSQIGSPASFWQFFITDRPLSAWTFILTFPLLGSNPLAWQVFTLLVRWGGVLALVSALNRTWLERSRQVRWVGFLLAVYPGFTQQAVSVAYSQHFITAALYSASILCTVMALRNRRRSLLFSMLGVSASLLQVLTMEYFAGLELLRPLLIWIVLSENEKIPRRVLRKTLVNWLPYLAVLAGMLVYRFVIFPAISPEPDMNFPTLLRSLTSNPANAAIHLVQIALQDSLYAVIFAWFNALQPAALNLQARFVYFAWALGAAAAGLLGFYSLKTRQDDSGVVDRFHLQASLLGCLGVLLGGLPVWLTDRQIIVGMWSDRFSLAPMVGAALLVVVLVDWFGVDRLRRTLLLSGLVAAAVAFQAQVANRYRLNWEIQRAYYWQLSWRAPGINPGTAVIGPEVPFSYVADMSLGFAYNVLYDHNPGSSRLPIWFFTAGRLWGLEELNRLQAATPAGLPVQFNLRNLQFDGNTGAAVGIQFNPTRGCLRVTDRVYSLAPVLSDDPSSQFERFLYQFSNPDRIQSSPTLNQRVLSQIFGAEPAHGWCFYYEKADLARQLRDWAGVGRLGDEVIRLGYKPANAAERIPFIEGFAHLGQWDRALEWTLAAFQQDSRSQAALCQLWKGIAQEPGIDGSGTAANWIQRAQEGIQCSP